MDPVHNKSRVRDALEVGKALTGKLLLFLVGLHAAQVRVPGMLPHNSGLW